MYVIPSTAERIASLSCCGRKIERRYGLLAVQTFQAFAQLEIIIKYVQLC